MRAQHPTEYTILRSGQYNGYWLFLYTQHKSNKSLQWKQKKKLGKRTLNTQIYHCFSLAESTKKDCFISANRKLIKLSTMKRVQGKSEKQSKRNLDEHAKTQPMNQVEWHGD
jgi:hypothetical protein